LNENKKIISDNEKPLLLFSPLDWGLGHTTRCIPLIQVFLDYGWRVIVACESTQKIILQYEFPEIGFVYLEGYGLRFSVLSRFNFFFLLLQIPKILIRINKEKIWIRRFLAENKVHAVISDNRYGFYPFKGKHSQEPEMPAIFITHQLNILTGMGRIADRLARSINYKRINRFTGCWVPDFPGSLGTAGTLSHPDRFPQVPVTYIGCISRFKQISLPLRFDLLIILSGPEPQRTVLENECLKQLRYFNGKSVLVRGLPSANQLPLAVPGLLMFNHAAAGPLNQLICESKLVISRSGYTSIMDLLKLGKKMVLIPTPGQTEQEYLGNYLSEKGMAVCMQQDTFSIESAVKKAAGIADRKVQDVEIYKPVIQEFSERWTGVM